MYLGINYSSLKMETCLSRCSRNKGQFLLYIWNKAVLVIPNVMQKVLQEKSVFTMAFVLMQLLVNNSRLKASIGFD